MTYFFPVVSLNFLWELRDYWVLSYYCLKTSCTEAGYATCKSQIVRKYLPSWRVSDKTPIRLGCQPGSVRFTKCTYRSFGLLIKPSRCTGYNGRINIGWRLINSLTPTYLPNDPALMLPLAYWHISSFTFRFIDSVTVFFIYLTAICSQGCDSNHGSCVAPNTCQCLLGWTGSACVTGISNLFAILLVGVFCIMAYFLHNISFFLLSRFRPKTVIKWRYESAWEANHTFLPILWIFPLLRHFAMSIPLIKWYWCLA